MHAAKKRDRTPSCCAHDLMPTQGLRVPSPFLASKSPVPFSDRPLIRQICSLAGSDLSDEELLKRFAKDGDSFAADVLVRRYIDSVHALCRSLLFNRQDAEDATQATFLVFARKASTLQNVKSVGAWLRGVAYRVSKKLRCRIARESRALGAQTTMTEAFPDPDSGDPLSGLTLRELARVLEREIALLRDDLREPFRLCHLEGLSRGEAARQLGYSVAKLQRRLKAARSKLEARLLAQGFTLAALLAACGLAQDQAFACAPPHLVAEIASRVVLYASGRLTAEGLPQSIAALLNAGADFRSLAWVGALATGVLCLAATGTCLALGVMRLEQPQKQVADPVVAGSSASKQDRSRSGHPPSAKTPPGSKDATSATPQNTRESKAGAKSEEVIFRQDVLPRVLELVASVNGSTPTVIEEGTSFRDGLGKIRLSWQVLANNNKPSILDIEFNPKTDAVAIFLD